MYSDESIVPLSSVHLPDREIYNSLKVLVAEDVAQMFGVICGILKSLGVGRVVSARSGQDVLDITNTRAFDLAVISDLQLHMDGLFVVREIRRSKSEKLSTMPVIYITSKVQKENIIAARDSGVTEILSKPFSAAQMISRINMVLARPRPHIKAKGFVGPDRRRRVSNASEYRRVADNPNVFEI